MNYKSNSLFPDVVSWRTESVSGDERGFSYEPYRYVDLMPLGIPTYFLQELFSFSRKNVFRGLHYGTQGLSRLIHVVYGSIEDIFVDLRKDSPTFGKWGWESLAAGSMIYVPKHYAHGFYTFADTTLIYHFTKLYTEKHHRILAYDDPQIGIVLPEYATPIVSNRDKHGTLLKDLDFYF